MDQKIAAVHRLLRTTQDRAGHLLVTVEVPDHPVILEEVHHRTLVAGHRLLLHLLIVAVVLRARALHQAVIAVVEVAVDQVPVAAVEDLVVADNK